MPILIRGVDIIRTAYYIRGLELMKLIFAVLDVSLTMGLTRCYKTKGFLHLYNCKNLWFCDSAQKQNKLKAKASLFGYR